MLLRLRRSPPDPSQTLPPTPYSLPRLQIHHKLLRLQIHHKPIGNFHTKTAQQYPFASRSITNPHIYISHMEKRASSLLFLGIALALLFMALSAQPAQAHYKRPKSYKFYLHNTLRNYSSENFTAVVTAAPDLGPEFNQFGMLTTFEDNLTETSSNTSKLLGKGQGFYLYDVQKVHVMFFVFTAVIQNDKYNGTIDIMGQNPTNIVGKRYISVIGGTGDFFMARGLATLEFLGAVRNLVTLQVTWIVSFDLDLYY